MQTLQFDSITKRFPGVVALDNVSLTVTAGDCHALVGENGAGKSTLGKILAGIYRPDSGAVCIDGRPVRFASPAQALRHGISMVHQELLSCPNLSVAENIFLGSLPGRRGVLDRKKLFADARRLLDEMGMELDCRRPVESLSIAHRQMAQIACAVGGGARIVVMDEPTSSLSEHESRRLFGLLGRLRERGITIIYVSHRLEEVFLLTRRISVLRDGRHIQTLDTAMTDEREIVRLMVGRTVDAYFPSQRTAGAGEVLLSVRELSLAGRFENVSFDLRAGEIVGLGGLVGAGRSEVAETIFGLHPGFSGRIQVAGTPAHITSPARAMTLGIGLVPEDRKLQGLVLEMTAGENLSLPCLGRIGMLGFVRAGKERALVRDFFSRLSIRPGDPSRQVAVFSGGNQQKVVLSKWLARDCRILIIDEPTRGIDVGAKAEIHNLIDELAGQGRAILLISSELPEIINLCTRILVMRDGRLAGELLRHEANQEKLMHLMANVGEAA